MRNAALREIMLPELSGGINTRDPESDIADNQSPDMLNLWFRDMALCKRPGQMRLAGLADVMRISEPYNSSCAVHAGTKLLRWDQQGAMRNRSRYEADAVYEAGDYVVADAPVTIGGTTYAAGECVIYNVSAYAGQVETAAVETETAEGIAAAGDAAVTVTASGVAGTPLSFSVTLAEGDSAEEAAEKIRAALVASGALTAVYAVGGGGTAVTLTRLAPGIKDTSLNISVANDTCAGLKHAPESADTPFWHGAVAEIATGMPEKPGVFCEFGDTLYYIGGGEIWQIGADYSVAVVTPYAPVVLINARPDLSESDDGEPYNLIGAGFTVKYNGGAGGNVCYYVATVPTSGTFTVTAAPGSSTPVDITSSGSAGWRVRRRSGDWITGTASANAASDAITLAAHGLTIGDAVQFDKGSGTLPGGLNAYDSNKVTLYQLPQTELDDTAVKVTVAIAAQPYTAELTENVHFTVDRTRGAVDFAGGSNPHGAPMTGTSNVWITAYKTVPGAKQRIAGCTVAVRFGGEAAGVTGGTRVFVTGNAQYPYHYWRSDLGLHVSAGMTYFPDTAEEVLDQNSEAITTAAKMGESLIIFKENSIFAVGYSFDGQDVYYPVRECHSAIGCDMPGSVQLIDNRLVFAHTRSGVHILISTDNAMENIVKPLSANVNKLLLEEKNLKEACSCDFERYYWLCVNGHVYLWDYDTTPYYNYSDYDKAQRRLAWYRFDDMHAAVFYPAQGALYYGGAAGIVMLTKNHNDFGQPFSAYFKSKAFDLGSPDELKTFVCLYPGFSTDGNIKAKVSAGNERTDSFMEKEFDVRSFDWSAFNWDAMTWHRIKFAQVSAMRLNMRKAAYLQIKVSGGEIDRGVGLSSLRITYFRNRKVKG